jgi:hypothetical protein
MNDEENDKKLIKHFADVADKEGVAVSHVKDGYLLMFKKEHMQRLLNENDSDKLLIFIKYQKFDN